MSRIIHGALPINLYDIPVLIDGLKYWINAQVRLGYVVTRDPSSGGDFADWEVESYENVMLYDDDGNLKSKSGEEYAEVKRAIWYELQERDITEQCVEDALDFT